MTDTAETHGMIAVSLITTVTVTPGQMNHADFRMISALGMTIPLVAVMIIVFKMNLLVASVAILTLGLFLPLRRIHTLLLQRAIPPRMMFMLMTTVLMHQTLVISIYHRLLKKRIVVFAVLLKRIATNFLFRSVLVVNRLRAPLLLQPQRLHIHRTRIVPLSRNAFQTLPSLSQRFQMKEMHFLLVLGITMLVQTPHLRFLLREDSKKIQVYAPLTPGLQPRRALAPLVLPYIRLLPRDLLWMIPERQESLLQDNNKSIHTGVTFQESARTGRIIPMIGVPQV